MVAIFILEMRTVSSGMWVGLWYQHSHLRALYTRTVPVGLLQIIAGNSLSFLTSFFKHLFQTVGNLDLTKSCLQRD